MLALSTNAVEVYQIPEPVKTKEEPQEATKIYSVDLPGHRTEVRSLAVSSDDAILASASNGTSTELSIAQISPFLGSLKIWNLRTVGCIRTMDCGYAICSTFLPGDRHVRKSMSRNRPLTWCFLRSQWEPNPERYWSTISHLQH